ncbi:MAG TPA: aldehyde dehydrogenase family protein, partial [Thermoanaerobaculia bacterium]|nr:aldehyde dehydrogenase family protein [Thermoanaerobaculia bacterium]
MAIATVNPATGETLKTFTPLRDEEIEQKLQKSVRAADINRRRSFAERAARVRKSAGLLEERQKELGKLITVEMGKPVKAAVAEVNKCALVCRYYADHAGEFLADEPVKTEAETFIRYEPIGPILAVMPWNFPFWQVFRFAAPALMAGNVGLLKHASNVPLCELAIETVFRDGGFADGEFQTLLITSE